MRVSKMQNAYFINNYQVENPFGDVNHLHRLIGKGNAGLAHSRWFLENQSFGR